MKEKKGFHFLDKELYKKSISELGSTPSPDTEFIPLIGVNLEVLKSLHLSLLSKSQSQTSENTGASSL